MARNGKHRNLICKHCGITFDSKSRNSKQLYCSQSCSSKGKPRRTVFKKGQKPWNKGLLGYMKGRVTSEETKAKIGAANSGIKNKKWLGDTVGYSALHCWVRSKLGTAKECCRCGVSNAQKRIEYANISQQYKRDVTDWMPLCVKCHKRFDKNKQKKRLDRR